MFRLTGILKSLIGAALLNTTVRSAFRNALIKSINWITMPSTMSSIAAFIADLMKSETGTLRSMHIHTLLKGVGAFAILRLAKRSRIIEAAAISTIGAILLDMIKSRERHDVNDGYGQKEQIIDIDQYTVVDE